ncbi:MAG TPA: DR2241 family protein [Chthoniobacterales bacterium]|nr:DR2241 family protein [Chthoniobacterales bacterium]
MSGPAQEFALAKWLAAGLRSIGQISIEVRDDGSFALAHHEDAARQDLVPYAEAEDAAELARFDDAGNYRPLKTAPNLRHGWRLVLPDPSALRLALDLFYPGRLATFLAWEAGALVTTPLRATLDRQTGMYRSAAKIRDEEANTLVGNFCRSDGGCLRTILWKRDREGTLASTFLPPEKFDPAHDQTGFDRPMIPLLCQEACNLLVAEARKIAKSEDGAPATP